MSDPASQYWSESTNLRDQLDRRFSEEFTLKSPKDFLIRYDITVEGPPFSTRMMIRFKSEQAFALFKMKYYA